MDVTALSACGGDRGLLFPGFAIVNIASTLVSLPPVHGALPARVTLRLSERWQRKGDKQDKDYRAGPHLFDLQKRWIFGTYRLCVTRRQIVDDRGRQFGRVGLFLYGG
jgi:hypothetical protein